MIAALYVETDGCYFGRPDIDAWDVTMDARKYAGPYPVVAHPPCQRWGRFWHGSTRKPHQFEMGADEGCFRAALDAICTWGGVIEHPADSHAWKHFNILPPSRFKGWESAGWADLYTCYVEQGHYGHMSRKPTWLLTKGIPREALPELNWTKGEQRLHPIALAKHGYAKARRIGMTAMVGGKDKTKIRNATPEQFRDVLIGIAQSVQTQRIAA